MYLFSPHELVDEYGVKLCFIKAFSLKSCEFVMLKPTIEEPWTLLF